MRKHGILLLRRLPKVVEEAQGGPKDTMEGKLCWRYVSSKTCCFSLFQQATWNKCAEMRQAISLKERHLRMIKGWRDRRRRMHHVYLKKVEIPFYGSITLLFIKGGVYVILYNKAIWGHTYINSIRSTLFCCPRPDSGCEIYKNELPV